VLRRCVPADNAMAMESISEMRTAVSRGVETTERLRAFSHQSPSDHRVAADLDALAREAMRIASARARAGVRYELVDALGAAPPVRVTPGECVSALVNLIVNAIDAMPGGGTIEVSSGASEGGSWLRVVDDGPGMTPEVEQRVFEPFFTTKGDEGTGLGLATLYSFVQQSRGRVELRTAPGRGAAFTLWFPSADGPSSRPPRG
jgi:signal transduction histidine kinase